VHRDVSPQNVLVGVDGVGRVLDFGIAKAEGRLQVTRNGEVKGKLAYMAPEQVTGAPVDRAADVFAAGVVLWELLAGRGLFRGSSQKEILAQLLTIDILPPSMVDPSSPTLLDDIVLSAVERDVPSRTSSAKAVADALGAFDVASHSEVGAWVEEIASATLAARAAIIAEMEQLEYQEPSRKLLETALTQSTLAGSPRQSQAAPTSSPVVDATTEGVTAAQTIVDSPRARVQPPPPPPFRRRLWVVGGVLIVGSAGLGLGLRSRSTGSPGEAKAFGPSATSAVSSPTVAVDTALLAVPPSASSAAPPIVSSTPRIRPLVAAPTVWSAKSAAAATQTLTATQPVPSKPLCKTTLVWSAELKAMVAVRPPECPPP